MLIKFKHARVTGAPRAAEERQQRAPLLYLPLICPVPSHMDSGQGFKRPAVSINKIFPGCRLFPLNFDICSKGQVRFERIRRLPGPLICNLTGLQHDSD
jgi:hypothetical protein